MAVDCPTFTNSTRRQFIPGPTWVDWSARCAMLQDIPGHRSKAFTEVLAATQPVLRQLAGTTRPVYLATCSSWGMMEACLRNLVRPGHAVLNCCNGAFSDRWHEVARRCGLYATALRVPWGQPITPGLLEEALKARHYDLVTLVHAETSTGVLNPLQELAEVIHLHGQASETLLAVDVVSSYSATPLAMDSWGVDVMLAGTQKALALPPGMVVCAISERALERAGQVPYRGFYMDFLEYEKNAIRDMTISTPAIPLVYGLAHRTTEIQREGIENRWLRHRACRTYVTQWAKKHGWHSAAPSGFQVDSLNCLIPPSAINTVDFVEQLKQQFAWIIDPGYGAWKGKCIRLSNMGILTTQELDPLLHDMEQLMKITPA